MNPLPAHLSLQPTGQRGVIRGLSFCISRTRQWSPLGLSIHSQSSQCLPASLPGALWGPQAKEPGAAWQSPLLWDRQAQCCPLVPQACGEMLLASGKPLRLHARVEGQLSG